jgi:hypothetical protein
VQIGCILVPKTKSRNHALFIRNEIEICPIDGHYEVCVLLIGQKIFKIETWAVSSYYDICT